jgi:hypothetical protein
MRKPWAVFLIAVTAAIRAVPCEAQTDEIAFTHVAVVDVQSGKLRESDGVVPARQRRGCLRGLAENRGGTSDADDLQKK